MSKSWMSRTKTVAPDGKSQGTGRDSIFNSQVDELSRQIAKGVGLSERKIRGRQVGPGCDNQFTRGL